MNSLRKVLYWLYAGAVIAAAGCASPDFLEREQAETILPAVTAELESRAAEFSSGMALNPAAGVFINGETLNFFAELPEVLAERLALLGITEVYVAYDGEFFTDGGYQSALGSLLAELKQRGISARLAFKMSDTVWQRSPNFAVRNFINPKRDMLAKIMDELLAFNRSYPESPFTGVVFDMNVEAFSGHNLAVPGGQIYGWGENTFGPGKDNDMLIKDGFAMLEKIKSGLPGMNIGCLFSSELNTFAQEGKLSIGKVSDFAAAADTLFIRVDASASADIVRTAATLLPQSKEKQSSLYLELAVHAENNRPALRRRSFRQFMTGLNAVNSGCRVYPEFRGMAFDSFAGLEDIWEK